MLKTNQNILVFIEQLYNESPVKPILKHRYPAGLLLLKQGSPSSHVYIIKQGITKVFLNEEEENEKAYILEFLGRGQIIGEIEALKKAVSLCNIKTITDTVLYSIPKSYFAELINTHPIFSQLILDELTDRIIHTSSRASFQQLYKIDYTFLQFFHLLNEENQSLDKDELALCLGTTVSQINRILLRLQVKLNQDKYITEFEAYFSRAVLLKVKHFI